ncbi:hypothetical protein ACLB2K_066408 [Fragaria x ananassa]
MMTTSQRPSTLSEGAPRVVSARRKPKQSGGPPQKGNRGVVNCSKVSDIVKSTGKKIKLDFDWEVIDGPRNSDTRRRGRSSLTVSLAASVFREWKHDLSEIHRRSVANSSNRGKKELEHHSGRKPIIYRVAEPRDKGASLPVVDVYPVTYDINQPKAAEHYLCCSCVKSEFDQVHLFLGFMPLSSLALKVGSAPLKKKVLHNERSKTRKRSGSSKSLSDLEFDELKGFTDLGFVFTEEDNKDSNLVAIISGLQRLRVSDEGDEEEDRDHEEKRIDASHHHHSQVFRGLICLKLGTLWNIKEKRTN